MSKAPHDGGEKKEWAAKPEAPAKGRAHVPGACLCAGCKTHATRFDFCPEHYEQFKFGLIKKTGEPVPDWEKKYDHYMAYKARKSAQKVA